MSVHSLWVNLPTSDLVRSTAFFRAIGFDFDPKFTDAKAACMVVNEHIRVMLLTQQFFSGFTPKPVADSQQSTSAIMSLSVDDRAKVDEMMQKALAAGGIEHSPAKDFGFMYQRGFFDMDGHAWEVFHLNVDEFPKP